MFSGTLSLSIKHISIEVERC